MNIEKKTINFLTRDECANSKVVFENLYEAIKEVSDLYCIDQINVDDLSSQDFRTGYGTPTILVDDEDLFGVPKPEPAAPT